MTEYGLGNRNCAAVILAAGQGTRMESERPKVLHEVGGRAMMHHVMAAARQAGAAPTVVVVGPDMEAVSQAVTAFDGDAKTAVQNVARGTAHAVLAARSHLAEFRGDVFILFGDTPLIDIDTLGRMSAARSDGADVVVLGFHTDQPTGYGRLITDDLGRLHDIVEERDASPAQRRIPFCNSGVMLVDGAVLFDLVDEVACDNAKGEYYLTDIVAIARSRSLKCIAVEGDEAHVLGVNSRAELAHAEAAFQDRMRMAAMVNGATLMDPMSVYFSYDTRLGRDVTVWPNVVFGTGVVVEDGVTIRPFSHLTGAHIGPSAEIGPFARLRPGAVIGPRAKIGNFVEIKKSRLDEGVKVNHLSYVGDAVVGAGANIGAGTIVCNYDGYEKHETQIGRGAFIGSNNCLVAPVRIGDNAYTASGSVISKDVSDGALALTRAPQEEKPGWVEKFAARKKAAKQKHK